MRLLVTGASGFIGKNFLLGASREWEIVATYLATTGFPDFLNTMGLHHVLPVRCDLTESEEVEALAKEHGSEFEAILFLAANGDPVRSVAEPAWDLRAHTLSLVSLLERIQCRRLVYLSSGAVYEGLRGLVSPVSPIAPTLPYAVAKQAAERYVIFFQERRRSVEEYIILRFFGAYGPYEPPRKIFTRLVKAFHLEGQEIFTIRGDGKNLIDAMYVREAVGGLLKVLSSTARNVVVDFGSGDPLTVEELVIQAARVFGRPFVQIHYEGTVAEHHAFRMSPLEMERLFGFRPSTPLADGLTKLARHLEQRKG